MYGMPHTGAHSDTEPLQFWLHVGKAVEAQGRCTAREQAEEPEQARRADGGASRASAARAGGAGGAGGMRFQDAGFGGLHPHNAEVGFTVVMPSRTLPGGRQPHASLTPLYRGDLPA